MYPNVSIFKADFEQNAETNRRYFRKSFIATERMGCQILQLYENAVFIIGCYVLPNTKIPFLRLAT